ncbi:UDP-glycosyltransferase 90A1 isoform X2 [Brachypodium distachyon]|uniref:UDP-glycosyltransferase 90A1 isoform X2 n=1 Tax=Brachypodium distachyon TaxID=15368 RepID=UPI000D0E1413|nr:UDP-glycosyltransferase 90A1 isoform X2 [Brachypodium distachyon]|eukprot:XP_024314952.1 UDP-glycosyltransferase 90A1 isoform X2 [Brachypodium distachyon]
MGSSVLPHVALFPFLAKGHTIPYIQLAHRCRCRRLATVTFFTTRGSNAAFVRAGLSALVGPDDDDDDSAVVVVELEFPADGAHGVPRGVESAGGLTSVTSIVPFVHAVSLLQPQLDAALQAAQDTSPVSLLIADPFLHWANASAARIGVPRVSFFATSMFMHVMQEELVPRHNPFASLRPGEMDNHGNPTSWAVPEFPHIRFTFEDLIAPLGDDPAMVELGSKVLETINGSHGLIVNSSHVLEGSYIDFWNNQHLGPKAWPVGPLCCLSPKTTNGGGPRPPWMEWLDSKQASGHAILYIALGTMSAKPEPQLRALADGLERAGVGFIWPVRPEDIDLGAGFKERTKGRGLVVREWVDQPEILRHPSVQGFLTHCGWNSILEGVTAGVPMAAWPMNSDQPFHAKLVVDDLRIAVRSVRTSDGTLRGPVTGEEISELVRELMLGEAGIEAAKKAAELSALAKDAMAEGGSSWNALEEMIAALIIC